MQRGRRLSQRVLRLEGHHDFSWLPVQWGRLGFKLNRPHFTFNKAENLTDDQED